MKNKLINFPAALTEKSIVLNGVKCFDACLPDHLPLKVRPEKIRHCLGVPPPAVEIGSTDANDRVAPSGWEFAAPLLHPLHDDSVGLRIHRIHLAQDIERGVAALGVEGSAAKHVAYLPLVGFRVLRDGFRRWRRFVEPLVRDRVAWDVVVRAPFEVVLFTNPRSSGLALELESVVPSKPTEEFNEWLHGNR